MNTFIFLPIFVALASAFTFVLADVLSPEVKIAANEAKKSERKSAAAA
jgi:hypothetical protein